MVVHANQDARQLGAGSGGRIRDGQRRPGVVQEPAVAAFVRVLAVEIEVDWTAEVDPAHECAPVLVAERFHLAGFHRLRRRHDAAGEIAGCQDLLVLSFLSRQWLFREPVDATAKDLPYKQAAPRLEATDAAGDAGVRAGGGARRG